MSRNSSAQRSMLAIGVALVVASCGGSSSDVGTGTPEPPSAASDQTVEDTSGGDDEESQADANPATEPAVEPASGGASSAVLVLDGVEHVFDDFAQCLTFDGFAVMSVVVRNAAGDKLQVSYEEVGTFEDDEDSQYANTVRFEPADGNSDWRSGTVIGQSPSDYGALDWSLTGTTITGTGEFTNTYDVDSPMVPGTIDATCAE